MGDAGAAGGSNAVRRARPRRRTCVARFEAILWRHENGAKWRAVPAELGPWWRAAQIFIRWARLGVWERLLNLVQERGIQLGMTFLDGTSVRAHQKAAGARRKGALKLQRDDREALGRSRGGYGTKACVIADGLGRAIAFRIAPGQAHELPHAIPLLEQPAGRANVGRRQIAATPAMPFASTSGAWAHDPPSRQAP